MNWRWISLAALLAALVIGYGALTERNPAPAANSGQAERPGYYLQDAIITQTQKDGSVSLRLVADRIQQQHLNDNIALETVRVNYFQSPEHARVTFRPTSASYNCSEMSSCGPRMHNPPRSCAPMPWRSTHRRTSPTTSPLRCTCVSANTRRS
jgi:lipopolysaccharide export system protein LptC